MTGFFSGILSTITQNYYFMLTQMRRLPLYIALAAFVLYIGTMGSGLTQNGLPLASKLAGWDGTPMIDQPVLWLLTLPLRVLPAAWMPLALKLLAAVLAAAILGLLTRTVQLLPWDHPWTTASRFACALPALTACVLCGLEFSFWHEATSNCGELLDLLLLATALWLLLEYDVRRNSRWLDAATIVWGVGMAQNWVMLVSLPLFVAGVIWLERLRFFRREFVLRLAALGLAGFSVYIVLPTVNGLMPHSPLTFTQAWIISLHQTKSVLLFLCEFWRLHRLLTAGVAICFLVPTLPLLVHMRDEGTQNKSGADRFQFWIYRSLRLGLLLACVWLALDSVPGARSMVHKELGVWLPMVTYDYLNALGAAFLMGNLLLISQTVVKDEYRRSRSKIPWQRVAPPIATAGLVVIAIGLSCRNAPAIVHLNFHSLELFGDVAVNSLPADRGVVLSDDPEKLMVFQAALARQQNARDWLAVDTRMLPTVQYRARLEQRQPAGWLTDKTRHELNPVEMLRLLEQVAHTNRMFYLHPSYGYFFEGFYLEPAGPIYELKLRGKEPLDIPPLPDAAIKANEQFWTGLWDKELAGMIPPSHRPTGLEAKLVKYGLTSAPREQDRLLGEWFSISLEAWAVILQKQNHLQDAKARADQALQLNTNNTSARITLACNAALQAGARMSLADVRKVADQLGDPDRVHAFLNNGGPFDEPTLCYVLGCAFFNHGLLVQAAEQLERVRTLVPDSPAPELALAEIYNRLQMPDRSRSLISHVREEVRKAPANSSLDLDLALMESYSWLLQTNVANAREALESVVKQHPDDPQIASRVTSAYLAFSDVTNALDLINERLAKSPDDVSSLSAKAATLLQAGRSAEAIPILDHILALTNLPAARVNRAFARLLTQDFARAKSDLNELENDGHASGMVDFGLALAAEHDLDTNSARRYLLLCLSNTPSGAPLWYQANTHLQMLKPAATVK